MQIVVEDPSTTYFILKKLDLLVRSMDCVLDGDLQHCSETNSVRLRVPSTVDYSRRSRDVQVQSLVRVDPCATASQAPGARAFIERAFT